VNQSILFALSIFCLILSSCSTFVFAIDTQTLTNSYANQKCNISINYPSNWKFEETSFDDPATVINYIVELKPDNDEGFRNVVGIELDDISSLPDKSFEGIKDYEEEALSTVVDLDRIITSDSISPIFSYPDLFRHESANFFNVKDNIINLIIGFDCCDIVRNSSM
jgi:hypothetical protein